MPRIEGADRLLTTDDGIINETADRVPRVDTRWSDLLLSEDFDVYRGMKPPYTFKRLVCFCGCKAFEVLGTGDYETSAKCNDCGRYYIVHSG